MGIDCFGKLCPLGNSLIEVEDHFCVESSLLHLGLGNSGACCGTDRAPGWKVPLEKCGIKHFYDTWHFSRNAMKVAGGMSEEARDYRSSINEAMYRNFHESCDSLKSFLFNFQNSLRVKTPKYNLVTELIKDQKKLCYTYTGQNFICSGGSATRGEVVMSWIKARSAIKTKMAEWNLYDYYNYYNILICDYTAITLSEIEKS